MPQKMTKMVLNTVDLECSCCYKKVKKVLCKFPEIRDQVYDEKNNKVIIKILCCSPENIRDKLCCKGRKVIISIEIVDDTPTTETTRIEIVDDTPTTETTRIEIVDDTPTTAETTRIEIVDDTSTKETEKTKEYVLWTCTEEYVLWAPEAPAQPLPGNTCGPAQGYPPMMHMYPNGTCCGTCSQGYGGGPCYHGYGRPVPPPPRPCYDYEYGYCRSKCCVCEH